MHVARPRLVQPHAPGRQRLVAGDRDLDAHALVELLRSVEARVELLRVLGVEVGDAAPHQRHAERLARVVEHRRRGRGTARPPRTRPTGWSSLAGSKSELVVAPADPGRVDGVRDGVARADVVERAVQLRPDVLLEVRDQVVVQRLDQLAARRSRESWSGEVKMTSNSRRPVAELRERLVERVERRHADADALLLAELLEHRRVEVVGVVVDLQLAAALGLAPALTGVADLRQRDRVVAARERDARRRRPGRRPSGRPGCRCRPSPRRRPRPGVVVFSQPGERPGAERAARPRASSDRATQPRRRG